MKIIANKNNVSLVDIEQFTSGSYADRTIDVELSADYNGLTSFVTFDDVKVPIAANQITTPEIYKGICKIGVYGFAVADEEVTLRLSPTPCEVLVAQGSYTSALKDGDTPTESEYEKFYDLINQAIEDGKLKGADAKINGKNAITIEAGRNVTIEETTNGIKINATGGSGGTSDYSQLSNKPCIDGNELDKNSTSSGLGLAKADEIDYNNLLNQPIKLLDCEASVNDITTLDLDKGVYGCDKDNSFAIRLPHTNGTYAQFVMNPDTFMYYGGGWNKNAVITVVNHEGVSKFCYNTNEIKVISLPNDYDFTDLASRIEEVNDRIDTEIKAVLGGAS